MEQKQQQKIIGNYVILAETLGIGAFAICQKAFVQNDPSQLSAVKIISKLKLKEETFIGQHIERICQEIQTQKQLNSEYIVKILEVQQSANNIYVFLEYCNGGNLQQFKKNKKGILAESEVIKILNSLKSAFEKMYEKNCIHRDLKPENIMLHDGQIKLADFGFAKIVEDMNKPEAQTQLGTPLYIPLEILEQQPYSSKCDVFSLGIIVFELLFGFHPFYIKESQEISFPALAKILKSKKLEFPGEIAVHNKLLVDLISKMLQIDENNRISWPEFFTHQFFTKQNEENIQQQFEINNTQDSLDKALLKTNKYLNTNLVQGDISLIKKNAKVSILGATQLKELQAKYSQEDLNKKVDEINHYMNYERNIAIFYSNIVQQCFTLNTSRILKLQKEQFYKLLFLLSKFSLIFLNNVEKYLTETTELKALKDQAIFKYAYYQFIISFQQTYFSLL